MKPFLKWAGGKKQIMKYILPYMEKHLGEESTFYEPFVGGGSVFLALKRSNCVINDLNQELMNCYQVIRENPDELIKLLEIHESNHKIDDEYFYKIRILDRDRETYEVLTNVEKAARTIYLNRTCYNGLYRVNKKGLFNTPKGRYKNPRIVDKNNILEISDYLKKNNIILKNEDFTQATSDAKEGDFVYFDPPYDYDGNGFTSYVKEGFTYNDLEKLKASCDILIGKGVKILISNNATDRVLKLFDSQNYKIVALAKYEKEEIDVRRYIGSKITNRKVVKEVLIYGHN